MAAIGTIRKQSGLLIVLIGMAMLLFLLGDLFSGGPNIFTQQEQVIGTIAGQEISMQDYEVQVQEAIEAQFGVEGATEQDKQSIRERIWEGMVRERVLETQLDQLGMSVSADEILDQVRNTKPGSVLYQYFTDQQTGQIIEQFRDPKTGGLNSERVLQAINNLLNSENSRDWLPIERAIQQDIATNKYTELLSKGMLASSIEARQISKEKTGQATFSYVLKEFAPMNGEEYEPSDEDLKAYYEKHKHEDRFKVEDEIRSLKIAVLDVIPTPEDILAIEAELKELRPEFEADSNDTAFVAENAEGLTRQMIRYRSLNDLNPALSDTLPKAAIGAVFGPVNEGGRLNLHKLIGIKNTPDSVRASHILISVSNGDTTQISKANALLDSLRTVAESQGNFDALATEFSEDPGSAVKGGDLDWFTRGRMVAPFEKASFSGKIGDMVIVESQFGVHLIHITDQTSYKPQYLLATVDRIIEPSKETSDEMYNQASRFSIEHKTLETFESPTGDIRIEPVEGLRVVDENVGPINNARDIVRWAFEAEVGDVSAPFENERFFIVAILVGVSEAGIMSFDDAKRLIYAEAANERKARMIMEEMGDYSTLEQAANALGADVKTANNVTFAQGSLPGGLGREMKVLGYAFSLPEGQVSKPIHGTRGVFVIEVKTRTNPDAEADLSNIKRTESGNMASRVNSQVYNALKKDAGVKDQRAKYY
ncbi:MAG: peptidylprolyl isomerase [Flavobacteriales bacterium]|nr:peptidylprolyl isomerase [Flavobacteriales bacterium]